MKCRSIRARAVWTTSMVVAGALVAGALLVSGYAALMTRMGYAWPYPRVLPHTTQFNGASYHMETFAGCRTLADWSRIQHSPLAAYHSVGGISSAVYFFRPAAITQLTAKPPYFLYQWILVKNGDCYVYYQGDFGP